MCVLRKIYKPSAPKKLHFPRIRDASLRRRHRAPLLAIPRSLHLGALDDRPFEAVDQDGHLPVSNPKDEVICSSTVSIPMKKYIRSREGRDPYEKLGSGAIMPMFPVNLQGFMSSMSECDCECKGLRNVGTHETLRSLY